MPASCPGLSDSGDSCVQGSYVFVYMTCLSDTSEKTGAPPLTKTTSVDLISLAILRRINYLAVVFFSPLDPL